MKMPEELGDCPLTHVMYERIVRHCVKVVRGTTKYEDIFPLLVKHLEGLLWEQLKRAQEETK